MIDSEAIAKNGRFDKTSEDPADVQADGRPDVGVGFERYIDRGREPEMPEQFHADCWRNNPGERMVGFQWIKVFVILVG